MTEVEKEMSFYGNVYSEGCPGCNRVEPQESGLDVVLETSNFRVHQDYVLPIPGMMVIETKRHIQKITDLSSEESLDLVNVWKKVEESVSSLEGIDSITAVLEERSSHFHLWLLPIYPWMKDVASGKLRNIQEIFDHAKTKMLSEVHIAEVETATQKIKKFLLNTSEKGMVEV